MKMYNEYFLKYSRNSWVGSWAKGKAICCFETWGRPLDEVLSGEG